MNKQCKLIIVGDSSFAQIAYEYFTHDSNYSVVAFSVEKKYLNQKELFGLPVVPFENLPDLYNPNEHAVYVAVVYAQLNRLRSRLYARVKKYGYEIASYISSKAFVWPNVRLGEHCFIFENNVIQPFVSIGNNNVFWSGNHIGHHTTIGDNCFVASHVVISGHCKVGNNCFFGVNSTVSNNISISDDSVVGASAVVMRDILEPGCVYKGVVSKSALVSSYKIFDIENVDLNDEVD
ncbi:UDP-N-acetylbacillosamine N-acetyltransferase [Aquicella siphonis]|uniref:UDP-N-acetylbacillosamine N-acetyltransferase n=1 Tax=Aquicella siphonis TaxID=254247 RepID=A0A5E4PJK2_9COXI|nr:acetyltransferase [Aquicella siphonis]VVC76476.1 UDP-N-acetylbacillosamine N-acetyltransferase [Aquicella siphonis]